MKKLNVAIDGTSGVGKSTTADLLAEKYHMVHLDTGAMYRAAALALARHPEPFESEKELQEWLDGFEIAFDENNHVLLNGQDVSRAIREDAVSAMASKAAAMPAVRKMLVRQQQAICKDGGYIVDGRDICSVVLPDADLKLFLSASPQARAARRAAQNAQMGIASDYETILKDIQARDYQDSTRAISPLKKAEDATEVDTSALSQQEVVDLISSMMDALIRERSAQA